VPDVAWRKGVALWLDAGAAGGAASRTVTDERPQPLRR